MSRKADVVLLCEDKQHECFFRRLLTRLGYHPRRITVRPYPRGAGSGKAFVTSKFAVEVREQRARCSRMNCVLVTATDADEMTVDRRYQQLLGQLDRPRTPEERIAIFIPKWEIET